MRLRAAAPRRSGGRAHDEGVDDAVEAHGRKALAPAQLGRAHGAEVLRVARRLARVEHKLDPPARRAVDGHLEEDARVARALAPRHDGLGRRALRREHRRALRLGEGRAARPRDGRPARADARREPVALAVVPLAPARARRLAAAAARRAAKDPQHAAAAGVARRLFPGAVRAARLAARGGRRQNVRLAPHLDAPLILGVRRRVALVGGRGVGLRGRGALRVGARGVAAQEGHVQDEKQSREAREREERPEELRPLLGRAVPHAVNESAPCFLLYRL